MSADGHTPWSGALPVGRAVIHTDQEKAWAHVQFLLATQAGRETFEVAAILVRSASGRTAGRGEVRLRSGTGRHRPDGSVPPQAQAGPWPRRDRHHGVSHVGQPPGVGNSGRARPAEERHSVGIWVASVSSEPTIELAVLWPVLVRVTAEGDGGDAAERRWVLMRVRWGNPALGGRRGSPPVVDGQRGPGEGAFGPPGGRLSGRRGFYVRPR